jgi:hypothetical protein
LVDFIKQDAADFASVDRVFLESHDGVFENRQHEAFQRTHGAIIATPGEKLTGCDYVRRE